MRRSRLAAWGGSARQNAGRSGPCGGDEPDAGNGTDIATSLAVNPASGTVYVTGTSFAPSGLYDYATVAYTAAGTRQWVKRPVGSVAYPSSVAVSSTTGTVFVTGANAGDYTTTAYQG